MDFHKSCRQLFSEVNKIFCKEFAKLKYWLKALYLNCRSSLLISCIYIVFLLFITYLEYVLFCDMECIFVKFFLKSFRTRIEAHT